MADEARAVPAYRGRLPNAISGEASRLSEMLPHLVVEARNVASQLQLGIHGRRRAGPGEEFWEFRPFVTGESASRVDWRRSARDDRLFVREREWESASVHWLWFDLSPSMHFASTLAGKPKRDRALVLGLALAELLVHAGERVGLLGRTNPIASRSIIMRLAEALMRGGARSEAEMAAPFPGDYPIRKQDHLILVGDFIMPMEEFSRGLARLSQRGVRGTVVLIRDPSEETFPFGGEVEFEGLEESEVWRVGDALDIASRYRQRIADVNEELRRIAIRHGFHFLRHVTVRPPAEALLALAGLIGGQPVVAPRITKESV